MKKLIGITLFAVATFVFVAPDADARHRRARRCGVSATPATKATVPATKTAPQAKCACKTCACGKK